MICLLVERGADVNLSAGEQDTAVTAALRAESFEGREYSEWEGITGITESSLQTRATLELLVELGADFGLCATKDRDRAQTLLEMSNKELRDMNALQDLAEQTQFGTNSTARSFRGRRNALRQLIADGVNPSLCCQRDMDKIEEILMWSEQEVDKLDEHREHVLAWRDKYDRGPL